MGASEAYLFASGLPALSVLLGGAGDSHRLDVGVSSISSDWHLQALHAVRLAQPALVIVLVLIALARPYVLARARTRVADIDTEADAAAPASGRMSPTSAAPQPTPVMVPVRSRRRALNHFLLLALAATYVASGALIALRAALPDHVWTPSLPRWAGSDAAALLGLLAWASVAGACAIEARIRGQYGRGKVLGAVLIGACTDAATLGLYASSSDSDFPKTGRWTAAQLALILVRLAVLYPACALACSDSTRFVRAADLRANAAARAREQQANEASPTRAAAPPGEGSSLLTGPANGTSANYGSTGATTPATNGAATPANQPAPKQGGPSGHATGSMGLSVGANTPAPTVKVFAARIASLFPYLWPRDSASLQGLALLCAIILVAGRVVNLFVPLTLGKVVDDLTEGTTPWTDLVLYAGLKALQGNGGLLSVAQAYAWIPVEQWSDRALSIMAFEKLLDLSMAFHTKRKTGEVLRILDRGSVISSFFQYLFFQVTPIFVDLAVAVFFLWRRFGWGTGVTLAVVMVIYTWVSVAMTTWRTALRRQANNLDSVSRAIHADSLLNWETIKGFSAESYEVERYRKALLAYQASAFKVTASLSLLNMVQNLIITFGTLLASLLVASAVVRGEATSSDFVVMLTYVTQVVGPLNWLGTLYRVIQQNLVDTDKLVELLAQESDVKDLPDAKDLVVTNGEIEFRDVVFSYDGKINALAGVSFKINMRSTCALVGESGAGKSSILRLLYRFYDIQSGQILIDGQDISKVTQESLRKAIGIVPQEPSLFNTDIKHNILYGDHNASDEAVEAAARAAQIWDRIQGFPDGMDTVVGERGVRLSGGEKQRVALARTFLKNPKILLLDEATSALDTSTEQLLQTALSTLLDGRSSLTIAHRLSTIVNSDRIVVLDAGRVVESGSHAELVGRNGVYAGMWRAQINEAKNASGEALSKEDAEQSVEGVASGSTIVPDERTKGEESATSTPAVPKAFLGVIPVSSPNAGEAPPSLSPVKESPHAEQTSGVGNADEAPVSAAKASWTKDTSAASVDVIPYQVPQGQVEADADPQEPASAEAKASVTSSITAAPTASTIPAATPSAAAEETKTSVTFPATAAEEVSRSPERSRAERSEPGESDTPSKFRQRITSLVRKVSSSTSGPSSATEAGTVPTGSAGSTILPPAASRGHSRAGSRKGSDAVVQDTAAARAQTLSKADERAAEADTPTTPTETNADAQGASRKKSGASKRRKNKGKKP